MFTIHILSIYCILKNRLNYHNIVSLNGLLMSIVYLINRKVIIIFSVLNAILMKAHNLKIVK